MTQFQQTQCRLEIERLKKEKRKIKRRLKSRSGEADLSCLLDKLRRCEVEIEKYSGMILVIKETEKAQKAELDAKQEPYDRTRRKKRNRDIAETHKESNYESIRIRVVEGGAPTLGKRR